MERPLDEAGWKKAFGDLPAATQDRLRHWFATQALIVADLGLPEDEWFGLIGWAMEHPWDRSHLEALPAAATSRDAAESGGLAKQRAAALDTVGAAASATVATGDGLAQRAQNAQQAGTGLEKELYQRFMNQRMNEATRRPKGPPPAKPIKR